MKMVRISEIKAFFESTPIDGVDSVLFAVNDHNAAKRLGCSSVCGVQLCIVYPSASGQGGSDNGKMVNRITLLVLEKNGSQSDTAVKEFARFEKLQSIILDIRDQIGEAHSESMAPFCFFRQSDTLIEPIYNLGGYDGWGMDLYL